MVWMGGCRSTAWAWPGGTLWAASRRLLGVLLRPLSAQARGCEWTSWSLSAGQSGPWVHVARKLGGGMWASRPGGVGELGGEGSASPGLRRGSAEWVYQPRAYAEGEGRGLRAQAGPWDPGRPRVWPREESGARAREWQPWERGAGPGAGLRLWGHLPGRKRCGLAPAHPLGGVSGEGVEKTLYMYISIEIQLWVECRSSCFFFF